MTAMTEIGVALRERMERSTTGKLTVYKLAGVWHMSYGDESGYARASGLTPQVAARKLSERLGL